MWENYNAGKPLISDEEYQKLKYDGRINYLEDGKVLNKNKYQIIIIMSVLE